MVKKRRAEELDEISEAVANAVQIEPLTLEEEFVRIPSDLARFNELYAKALRRFLIAKRDEERTYSRLYMEAREGSDKKQTEATLRNTIEIDEKYQDAVLRRIDAEVEKVRLHGVLEALKAKKDSIISIGAHIRAEMGGDPRIRDQHRGARDVARSRSRDGDDE